MPDIKTSTYQDDAHIDVFDLVNENAQQPYLFAKWADREAEALRQRDLLHEQLKTYRSKLIMDIKADPKKYGLDKATTDAIDAAYRLDPGYIDLREQVIKAEHTAAVMSNARWTMEQKKKSLENIGALMMSGLYSAVRNEAPVAAKVDDAVRERQRSEATETLNERMNERRRRRASAEEDAD